MYVFNNVCIFYSACKGLCCFVTLESVLEAGRKSLFKGQSVGSEYSRGPRTSKSYYGKRTQDGVE